MAASCNDSLKILKKELRRSKKRTPIERSGPVFTVATLNTRKLPPPFSLDSPCSYLEVRNSIRMEQTAFCTSFLFFPFVCVARKRYSNPNSSDDKTEETGGISTNSSTRVPFSLRSSLIFVYGCGRASVSRYNWRSLLSSVCTMRR